MRVGDALETDILGANNFGLESLLITKGIHKNQLNSNNTTLSETHLKNDQSIPSQNNL